ncbi:MAG: class I SAM-dependent methyltransferase [Candidatus Margulisbacteria bacterium]|nr:class I SAM-dependent methyltransferase [Candidatus Margulisiibacteriota bacterium]
MKKTRLRQVFEHFDGEAKVFDEGILKSVPHYRQMIGVIVEMLPFPRQKKVILADIGTGTGNISYNIKSAFPNSELVCIDLSPRMLSVAKEKLASFSGVEYIQADVSAYRFDRRFDAIVSSLTLHHLETDADKHAFHKKAFRALKKGGYFINADIIIAPDKKMQDVNLAKWQGFILKSSSREFAADRYKKYKAEDRPAVLLNELDSLRRAGFRSVEVFWKYYNFAVYGGVK